ncbi:hypothetical protein ACQ4PT_024216 [Festuca glaucescens]
MAPSPPAPFLLLLALSGLAVAAAQFPFPPPQLTNASDADALRAVFKQWGLGYGATATTPEDPCLKKVWFGSLARNASIDCSCGDSTLPCRITHLNVTGYRNLTDFPPALFNLTELVSLDVSYNPLLIGILPDNPAGQKWSINYIGTSIDASRTTNSENLTLLNCLHMKGCDRTFYNNLITSCAVNCGGKQTTYPDSLSNMFYDDTSDLGASGFHVNSDRQWVVSNVGSDPLTLSNSPGVVNESQVNLGTDLPELYRTARTSRSDLWYYVVGLSNGKYTVQLFFAEIVIESELNSGPGRRSFNIDIQDRNIKTDFDITKEAGGFGRPTNITHEATVDNSVLKIHLYWNGRGPRAIPYEGAYGPLVSAIRVFLPEIPPNNSPPPARPEAAPHDNKRRGVVAGIAALCIAAAVISSSVVYLWWKWVSLVKHPNT